MSSHRRLKACWMWRVAELRQLMQTWMAASLRVHHHRSERDARPGR